MPFETKTAFQANFSIQEILLHARLKYDLIIGQHSGFFFLPGSSFMGPSLNQVAATHPKQ
jgi:hypothetical protein